MSQYDEIIDFKENREKEMKNLKKIMPKFEVVSKKNDGPIELPEGFDGDLYDSDYDNAVQCYSKENYAEALAICSKKDPAGTKGKYIALAGNCYQKQGNIELAVEKWKKAVELCKGWEKPEESSSKK